MHPEVKSDKVKSEFYKHLKNEYNHLALAWDIKINFVDFNAQLGREITYRPTIGPLVFTNYDNGEQILLLLLIIG